MSIPVVTEPAETAESAAITAELRQLLMQFGSALSRRRAYAATHPMVQAAEQQLHESVMAALQQRRQLTIGVARTDLLIDGEPYVTKSSFARDLATRLHRRGVGAIMFSTGVALLQVREALAWLASDPDEGVGTAQDKPPTLSCVTIALVAYDQLSLSQPNALTTASGERLWRSLAKLAGDTGYTAARTASPEATPAHDDGLLSHLRDAMQDDADVARRAAVALQDIADQALAVSGDVRRTMGVQLHEALTRLGASSFAPIIQSLGERTTQHRFVSQVVSVLPAAAVADWLRVAAQSREQQMSHHLLRLMSKLSTFAETHRTQTADRVLRSAAQDLVNNWMLDDPNPEEHVALLDRIAMFERVHTDLSPALASGSDGSAADVESMRLIQMALEIDVVGDDAIAAAEAIVSNGRCVDLMTWVRATGDTQSARALRNVAISDTAVRTMLLHEPVDRLEARALLAQLDLHATNVLIDVLAASEARGTRLLVRQRLAEFGAEILPLLLARLDNAPWFLVRNILTLLHDIALESNGAGAALEKLVALQDHAQVQVRIEAFRLLTLDPRAREAAIRHALHDAHERPVILALQALTDSGDAAPLLSAPVIAHLIAMVDAGAHSEPLRARMVRALAHTHDEQVLQWLLAHACRRSRILRRLQLADPTPVAVAAVHALRRSYASDATVQRILAMITKSGDERAWQSREPAVSQEIAA